VIAAGVFNLNGQVVAQFGFTPPVVHVPGSGVYTLTVTNPPSNPNFMIITALQISPVPSPGVGGQILRTFLTANTFDLTTYDAAGVPTDRSFYVVVHDIEP
jgi:hypothetical protein